MAVSSHEKPTQTDAGMRSLDHYAQRLPHWRRVLRDAIIPLVRWETPVLAKIQARYRSPAWDAYFAYTAILGTHTFFMVGLPVLNWCGYHHMFRAMCQMLAAGVFFSGILKDTVCLPRPLSPPLQRINRSHSAALEYGFPSTHSTNAVSVVTYAFYVLLTTTDFHLQTFAPYIAAFLLWYVVTLFLGRLYCGMHGFLDVIIGGLIGGIIAAVQITYGEIFDAWVIEGPAKNLWIVLLTNLVLVRIHPEPADDCPCFDDSVSFAGVFIGINVGAWRFARSALAWSEPMLATSPFLLSEIGYVRAVVRILLGVAMILAWRGMMKPTLLNVLPPIFRVVESLGLLLPRKHFLSASQYTTISPSSTDDVLPSASDIPALLGNSRKRTVSIGPQSAADAYEAIAFRQRRRRRESLSAPANLGVVKAIPNGGASGGDRRSASPLGDAVDYRPIVLPGDEEVTPNGQTNGAAKPPLDNDNDHEADLKQAALDQASDEAMFRALLRPRVRYDVEVLTKLIVYAGIGWITTEVAPVVFEMGGLGMGRAFWQ